MAAVLALPFVGGVVGRARAETRPAPAVPAVSAEETVWEHLDHCSSWEETVVKLRAYAEAGHADADVLRRVAATIERGISSAGPEPDGVLGLYPATALMLASLEHLGQYGTDGERDAQAALIRRLTERA